jgi:long-subunit acyl-CoA synthetase (AMP-forming)
MSAATLPEWLSRLSAAAPEAAAMRHKRRGVWTAWDFNRLTLEAEHFAFALRRLGVAPGSVVSILSESRPEWLAADLGTQLAGCVSHGVHPTWSAAATLHVLELARSEVVIVENAAQLRKLEPKLAAECLRRVVLLDERDVAGSAGCTVVSWASFAGFGSEFAREHGPSLRAHRVSADDTAWLQESPAHPQAHPLRPVTQSQALESIAAAASIARTHRGQSVLSFAPLAHAGERALVYAALAAGTVVHFAEQPATVLNDLQDVQPHWVHAPARFWEKQMSRIEAQAFLAPRWARSALRKMLAGLEPRGLSRLTARNIRRRLGLVRSPFVISSGGRCSPEVLGWYAALGVRVEEAYIDRLEEAHADDAERELAASCAIADALVFECLAGLRAALLRPEREFLLAWAQERQLPFTRFDDLLTSPAVGELLRFEVERANARLPEGDRIGAFRLILAELAADDEALSGSLRLRRDVVAQRHADLLEQMGGENVEAAKAAGQVAAEVLRGLRSRAAGDAPR